MIQNRQMLTIISGADHKFGRSLFQLLKSIIRHRLHHQHRIIIYDLGLLPLQTKILKKNFLDPYGFEVRRFPFEIYPDHIALNRCTYAWKPLIIHEVLEEIKGDVLWLDSATLILGPLEPITKALNQWGVYVPVSGSGTIQDWVHPQMIAYMQVEVELLKRRNRAGGVCAFTFSDPGIRKLVREWKELALIEQCIAPAGANTGNHRFDQALLSILLYRFQNRFNLWLTSDEVDISSACPISFLSVRNKLPNRIPLWADLLTRSYFMFRRQMDIALIKLKTKKI